MTSYLGTPSNWLSILEREGALAVIDQRLTYWQNLPLLTDNIIRVKSFHSASELLCEAINRKQIPWVDFCAHLKNWRMEEAILRQVNAQSVASSERESFEPPINSWEPAKVEAFKALLTQLERLGMANSLESMAAISNCQLRLNFYCSGGHMKVNFTLWFFLSYNLLGPQFANAIWLILQQNVPMSNTMIDAIR